MVLRIGDDQVVLKVNAQVFGAIQAWGPAAGDCPGSNDRSDRSGLINNAKRIAAPLQNLYVPFGIHGGGARIYERAFSGVRSVGRNARLAVAGDCGHDAGF